MANHKSAKNRIVRNSKRNVINGARRNRVRTFVNKEEAAAAFKIAESEMMSAARKGIFALNKAARTVSRLSKKIKAL
mgnify:CR=1 FL=1